MLAQAEGGRPRRRDVLGHRIRRAARGAATGGVALDRGRAARRAPRAARGMAGDAGARGRRGGAGPCSATGRREGECECFTRLTPEEGLLEGVRRSDGPARRLRSHPHAVRALARPRSRRQRRERGNAVRADRGGLAPARAGGGAPPHGVRPRCGGGAGARDRLSREPTTFATQHVLASPSESAMLEAFTHVSFP